MEIVLVTAFTQLFIPHLGLFWIWQSPVQSRIEWLLKIIIVASYIAVIAIAGPWIYLPWISIVLYSGILLLAAWHSYRIETHSFPLLPVPKKKALVKLVCLIVTAAILMGHIFYLIEGWIPPKGSSVSLSFPLRNGAYYILNGGVNRILNDHLAPSLQNLSEFRGQSYAIDILKPDDIAERGAMRVPQNLSDHQIYGEPVYSPCNGAVAMLENDLPDLMTPDTHRTHPIGNFIILDCDDIHVVLEHLQTGSITVVKGQWIEQGQRIADVGSSGDSAIPHLHIHAQHPGSINQPFSGDPVPMFFSGRFLVRNSVVNSDF